MYLKHLTIENLRRIKHAELGCQPSQHLIYGANGSGKTTVLEAIHLLSGGRSFRTARATDLIRHDTDGLLVIGECLAADERHVVGIEKTRRKTRFRLDGETVRSASTVVRLLPVLVLNTDSSRLLESGPSNRRALVDRLLFHVEPRYLTVVRNYYHLLKQRNATLRAGAANAAVCAWDEQLAEAGQLIHRYRQECVDQLGRQMTSLTEPLSLGTVTFRYEPGWNADGPLLRELAASIGRDRRVGNTGSGPHRAELKIIVDEKSAKTTLSRGQVKLLVTALIAGLARILIDRAGKQPILLVDDLAAELDEQSKSMAIQLLTDVKTQAFFTAIEYNTLSQLNTLSARMFHVEQGGITAC